MARGLRLLGCTGRPPGQEGMPQGLGGGEEVQRDAHTLDPPFSEVFVMHVPTVNRPHSITHIKQTTT